MTGVLREGDDRGWAYLSEGFAKEFRCVLHSGGVSMSGAPRHPRHIAWQTGLGRWRIAT